MEKLYVTIGGITREATDEEAAQIRQDWVDGAKKIEEEKALLAAKQALLAKLGITEEEVKLLLS